jgi:hypothetical protein
VTRYQKSRPWPRVLVIAALCLAGAHGARVEDAPVPVFAANEPARALKEGKIRPRSRPA